MVDALRMGCRSSDRPASASSGLRSPWTIAVILWLIACAAGMGLTLNRRFDRRFDLDTALWAMAGRNILRDGAIASRGGVHVSGGDFERSRRDFYGSHPPGLAWWMAGWMKYFGQSNTAVRAAPLAVTLLGALLLYALVAQIFGGLTAFVACVLYCIMPMTAFFSQSVDMEPWDMAAILAASLAYLAWCRKPWRRALIAMLGFVALGCWMDWPVHIFAGALAGVHLLFFRGRRRAMVRPPVPSSQPIVEVDNPRFFSAARIAPVAGLLAVPLLMFAMFVGYLHLNGGNFVTDALERAKIRMRATPLTDAELRPFIGPANTSAATRRIDLRPGWKILLDQISTPRELKFWFTSVFTPSALLLATVGTVTWRWNSRALARSSGDCGDVDDGDGDDGGDRKKSSAGGEDARKNGAAKNRGAGHDAPGDKGAHASGDDAARGRGADDRNQARQALGRLLVAVFIAQCLYSAAFAEGAALHEFWQYFLIFPVSILGAAAVVWSWRLWHSRRGIPEGAFAIVTTLLLLATPAMAWGPFEWRMRPGFTGAVFSNDSENGDLRLGYIGSLQRFTTPRDLILTRMTNLGFSLGWYSDRMILADRPLFTLTAVEALADQYPGHRVLYLLENQTPPALAKALKAKYPHYTADRLNFVLIRGQPDPHWLRVED